MAATERVRFRRDYSLRTGGERNYIQDPVLAEHMAYAENPHRERATRIKALSKGYKASGDDAIVKELKRQRKKAIKDANKAAKEIKTEIDSAIHYRLDEYNDAVLTAATITTASDGVSLRPDSGHSYSNYVTGKARERLLQIVKASKPVPIRRKPAYPTVDVGSIPAYDKYLEVVATRSTAPEFGVEIVHAVHQEASPEVRRDLPTTVWAVRPARIYPAVIEAQGPQLAHRQPRRTQR